MLTFFFLVYTKCKLGGRKMENEKKKVTSGKFISELIFGYIFYTILFGLICMIPLNIIKNIISSEWIVYTINLVIQTILTIFIWKCGVSSVIKKKTTDRENISKIIKSLWIYVIIVLIISVCLEVFEIKNTVVQIEQYTEKHIEQYKEQYSSEMLQEELNKIYNIQIPNMYIAMIISTLVDAITRVTMIRYTRHVLEDKL